MSMKEIRAELSGVLKSRYGGQKWSVLAIDNEPDNLALIQIVLEGLGVHVDLAYGGEEGLRLIETKPPSLVLLDLSMPLVDGWMVLEHIRSNPGTARLPVIAVTAHAMPSDRDKMISAGFNGYIIKPYHLETLLREILLVVNGAPAQ